VHDFGESDGFTYIVMPFIKTGTLAVLLTGQPLPFGQIRRVITQVGDALDCAHAQGLVHRDVKPNNVLIDDRGNCLLADFGIAKILEGADTLTATGGLIGTPKYMFPEQGMGNPTGGRSDVYSLGVVLYEMATGQVPFQAETPLAVVVKHIRDALPIPSQVNPDIPEPLERMIFGAMHKERSERFASGGAMVEAMSTMTLDEAPATELAVTVSTAGAMDGADATTVQDSESVPDAETVAANAALVSALPGGRAAGVEEAGAGAVPRAGRRRLVTIGATVLIVLALLWYFLPLNEPEAVLTVVQTEATTEVAGAMPAATDEGDTRETTPAPAATGELLISVDAPSSVTVDGEAVGRFDAGVPQPVRLPPGQHLVIATALDGAARAQAIADLDGGMREVVVLEIADALADLEAEGVLVSAAARAEENRRRRDAETAARDPFQDQGDGTFVDRQIGTSWTAGSFPSQGFDGLLWTDVDNYCNGRLDLAGISDWRLPTRDELDSVLQRLNPM